VQQPATCLQADSWAGLQGDARMRAQAGNQTIDSHSHSHPHFHWLLKLAAASLRGQSTGVS